MASPEIRGKSQVLQEEIKTRSQKMFKIMEVEAMRVKCRNGSCYEIPRGARRALYSLYEECVIDDIEKELLSREI